MTEPVMGNSDQMPIQRAANQTEFPERNDPGTRLKNRLGEHVSDETFVREICSEIPRSLSPPDPSRKPASISLINFTQIIHCQQLTGWV